MNELLVGAQAICKRFQISRARLKQWENAGAPIYRRGEKYNGPCCADYKRLLDWEQELGMARTGRLDFSSHDSIAW